MLKNFLLSKVSVLALTAIVLNSLIAPAWSVGNGEDENQNQNSSAITVKNSNENDENEKNNEDGNTNSIKESQEIDYFASVPVEITTNILTLAAFGVGEEKKDLSTLACVCKLWEAIVNNEDKVTKHAIKKSWVRGLYNIIDPQHIAIFDQFYKGVLIYRPIEGSDERMISLPISDLSDPLAGKFDLSQCGDAGREMSIATGYRKVQTPANADKVEIWFTPRFLVDKEMPQLAQNHHIRAIIGNWDAARAPIGIFWTWGGWDAGEGMAECDYLISESLGELGAGNLLENFQKGGGLPSAGDAMVYWAWNF